MFYWNTTVYIFTGVVNWSGSNQKFKNLRSYMYDLSYM